MSSSNIKKFKYSNKYDYPVALSEYLVSDDNQVVFKFYNGVSKTLKNFVFTIEEFNEEGKLLVTSTVEIKQMVEKNSYFIPKVKFKFNEETKEINYILNVANFDKLSYTDNEFLRPKIQLESDKLYESQEDKALKMKNKDRKLLDKNNFVASSFSDRFKLKLPKFIVTILVIFSLAFSGLLIYDFINKNDTLYYETSNYTIAFSEYEDGLYIKDFDGSVGNLTIADSYFNKKVLGIADKAFENSNIALLNINSEDEFIIGSNAFDNSNVNEINSNAKITFNSKSFSNCRSLVRVRCQNAVYVSAYAFENCVRLKEVYLDNAEASIGAFMGDSQINVFYLKESSASEFYQLFVNEKYEFSLYLEELGYFGTYISRNFFSCIRYRIYKFKYDYNAYIEDYSSLPNNKY